MDDLNIQAGVTVNAEQAEAAFDRVGDKAQKMANEVTKAADKAGKATDGMGDGAEKGAEKFTRAESRMRAAIQKSTRELEMLGKTASQKFEAQLEFKGLDKAKFQPFLDELRKAEDATKKAESGLSGLGSAAQAAGRAMAVAFSGAAAFGVVGKLVEVQREFDVLNSSLKTVTGSSAAAEREMAWLKDFAKETPFGLAQATQGFVKMKALGLDPTRAALTGFGNTASAMGKDLNQMIEAVADASTGEFERLKEFGIKAKKEGDNVSLTFQGVTTTIRNSAADITKYLEDIGNTSFGGAMEERAKTLDGTIAALGDTWDELFRTVSSNNVGSLIFDSVTLANGVLEDATTIIRAMGGAVGETSREFGSLSAIQGGVATFFETVSVLAANTLYVLRQTGDTMAGVAAGYKAFFSFDFDAVRAIGAEMKANGEAARKEIDATTARILNARKAQEEYARYATRNASAATDPRRVDLGGSAPRATGGVSSGTAKAVKETISEYDKLIKKLSDELPKAAAEAEAAQMGYNKAQTEFLALAGSPAWASFSNSQRAVVASMFEGKIASEEAGEAAKALSKSYAEAAAERIKTIQSMERAADSLQSQNDALREEIELIGLSTEQQTLVLQQRNDVIILTKEATLAELERQSAITGTQTRVEIALASEIEALKERNALLGAKGVKNAAVDAAKTAKDEWQKTTDSINQSLTDSLLRGFESGKDFAKNLRDTVINMFNTMVLRPVISAIVNPVAGAVTGMMGLSGAAQGGGNSVMGGIQTASNLNSLYGAGSQALFGGAAGASAASLGYANIVGMAGGDAIGALAAANGMWAGVATGAQAAAQAAIASNAAMAAGTAAALPAGTTAAAAGAGAGGASGALAAIPGWGWALAGIALLGGLAKKFDDSGTPHIGAGAVYSEAGGLQEGAGIYNRGTFGMGATGEYAQGTQAGVSAIATGLAQTFDGIAKAFGQTAGYEIATAFADDSSKDGAWGSLRISKDGADLLNWNDTRESKWAPREFANGEEGYKEYLAEIGKDTRTVLLEMDLPSWADTMLESIGDAANMDQLAATVQQIGAIQTTFVQLGKTMEGFAGLTDKAFEALMKASGGIESLAANAGTYYENFYSEAEKTAAVTRSVSDALSQVGLAMPTTRDEFRALVESQLALGEAGAEAVAALLGVSGAFASVTENMKRLQSDTANLQIELLRAQGNTAGANAAQRTLDTTGFTEAEVALYDYNTALRAQIDTIKEAATLRSSLIGLESSFAGGGFSRQYRAEDAAGTVSGLLADVGIQKDADMFAEHLLSATSEDVELYFRQIWNVLETDEARQKLVDVTGVMMDLAQGAGSAAEAFQKQQGELQVLAEDAARLFSARNSAGDLMDRISGAMGKQGTFGAQRESELWGALGSTRDAEKQVELASQLTDLVLSRQQLEVQNAERMLSFGRSLRGYVDGLKLGSLSPLTNAEKLAEASTQYNEMLGKAQGGDADAQAGLQGIASTYLDLARTYFAGNEQFGAIFGAVTSSLDALGVSSMSEAQQQLSLGTQSLGELQRLYSITETAYGSLNAQYETAVSELTAAQDALVLQSDSLDQLKDIAGLLSGLPAEIAVRLPAINTELATYLPPAMLVQQGAQGDNTVLIAELQALRKEVAELRAENRQDAQMVAVATVTSASASASQIADATAKAAHTNAVKQGAVLV